MELFVVLILTAAVAAIVLTPVARRPRSGLPARTLVHGPLDDATLDREVARYRVALRAGTICDRCRYANPAESLYCADCGRRLPTVAGVGRPDRAGSAT